MVALAPKHRGRKPRHREAPGQLRLPFAAAEGATSTEGTTSTPPLPSDDLGPDPEAIPGDAPFKTYADAIAARIAALRESKVRLAMKGGSHRPAPKRMAGIRRLRGGRFDLDASE